MNQGTKQRIVGTVALLALALIFLPIVFDGQGSYQSNLSSRIPEPPIISILPEPQQTRPVIIADTDAINIDASQAQTESEPEQSTDRQAIAEQVADNNASVIPDHDASSLGRIDLESDTVEVTTSQPSFSREVPNLASNGLPEGWSVQLGSFADSDNARNLLQNLLDAEYKAYSRIIRRESGQMTAVFVGPWLDRNRADQYQQRLEQEFNLAGLVVPYEIEKL